MILIKHRSGPVDLSTARHFAYLSLEIRLLSISQAD